MISVFALLTRVQVGGLGTLSPPHLTRSAAQPKHTTASHTELPRAHRAADVSTTS